MDRRVVAQLVASIDEISDYSSMRISPNEDSKKNGDENGVQMDSDVNTSQHKQVILLVATNR